MAKAVTAKTASVNQIREEGGERGIIRPRESAPRTGITRAKESNFSRASGENSQLVGHAPELVIHNPIIHNRVRPIALHIPWYGFRTQARLARDSGISRAAVSRLVRYEAMPSLAVALRLTRSLSRRLKRPLDVWEVFSLDGSYPTASVCDLCGCRSCLPPEAYDREDRLLPQYAAPGEEAWQVSLDRLATTHQLNPTHQLNSTHHSDSGFSTNASRALASQKGGA